LASLIGPFPELGYSSSLPIFFKSRYPKINWLRIHQKDPENYERRESSVLRGAILLKKAELFRIQPF
jgi:hypothetical protein